MPCEEAISIRLEHLITTIVIGHGLGRAVRIGDRDESVERVIGEACRITHRICRAELIPIVVIGM